jgi:uncharacterized protein (UPF0332 family)
MKQAVRRIWRASMRREPLSLRTTGEVTKSHRRAQNEFRRLAKDDPRVDDQLRTFLGRTFNLKKLADYETGPGSQVSPERAQEAIQTAQRFVDCVTNLIPPNGQTPARAPATPDP